MSVKKTFVEMVVTKIKPDVDDEHYDEIKYIHDVVCDCSQGVTRLFYAKNFKLIEEGFNTDEIIEMYLFKAA